MEKTQENQTLRAVLAKRMRVRRAELDISQEEMSLRCGMSQSYLSSIERGKRNVSLDNVEKIALALKLNPTDIFNI